MNNEDKNAPNTGGNNDPKNEITPPAANPRFITRRSAIAGGMSALALGVFNAKKASAQSNPPLLALGGLCEGHVVKLSPADSLAWMQQQLQKNAELQAFSNHFIGQGLAFPLNRAKVYMFMATPVVGPGPGIKPGIMGILPGGFVQVGQSGSINYVSLATTESGLAFAAGVVVNPTTSAIEQFVVYDLIPPGTVAAHSLTAAELQAMSVCDAAAQLGQPPVIPGRFTPSNTAALGQPEQSALLAMTYQTIMNDAANRSFYSQSAFNTVIAQTPLVQKFGDVTYQRTVNALGFPAGVALAACSCGHTSGCTVCGWVVTISVGTG